MRPGSRHLHLKASALALLVMATAPGEAATITNHDPVEHTITVVEAGSERQHTLKPSARLENICPKGCVLKLRDSKTGAWELEGDELVLIEDGFLYYDPADGQPPREKPDAKSGG
jgi:hypothetical protein